MAVTRSVRPRRSITRSALRLVGLALVASVAYRRLLLPAQHVASDSAQRGRDIATMANAAAQVRHRTHDTYAHANANANVVVAEKEEKEETEDVVREATPTTSSSEHGHDEISVPNAWSASASTRVARARGTCAPPGEAKARDAGDAVEATPCAHLDALLSKDSLEHGVLIITEGDVNDRIQTARESKAHAVIVAVVNEEERRACDAAGVPSHLPRGADGARNTRGYVTASWVLHRGRAAVLASSKVQFKSNPLLELADDGADVSGTIGGDGHKRARVQGMADPAMGWSQYAQSMVIPLIRSAFVVFRPMRSTLSLVDWLASEDADLDGTDDAFTDEILMPAHDARQRAGVSFRLMNSECFAENGVVASVPDGSTQWDGNTTHENSVIAQTPNFSSAKATVLRKEKCGIVDESTRVGPKPRALRYIADPNGEYPVNCDKFSDLCDVVKRVARNREVVAAVSNKNIFYMLGLFIEGLKKTKIENYIIVALDAETATWCKERDVPYYHRELQSITGTTDNHATSGLKFRILNEFVSTGTSVLLSDVDVVWMQDPFADDPKSSNQRLIYRDADIEGMTDGWDDPSAYGFSWNRQRRLVARNSGLFFVAATHNTQTMMQRLAERMATEKNTWDQTAYNEEQVYLWGQPKHEAYSGVSQRVMNYMCFMNSKYFFRFMRFDEDLYPTHRAASVHVNYHPEKPDRMVSIIAQYWKDEKDAIDVWNWGEGRKGAKECAQRPPDADVLKSIASSPLAQALITKSKAKPGTWSGNAGMVLRADGTLTTPWNTGKWGLLTLARTKNTLFMDFGGAHHILTLTRGEASSGVSETYAFTSRRCTDNNEVHVLFD